VMAAGLCLLIPVREGRMDWSASGGKTR